MSASLSVTMIVVGDEILNGRTTDLNGSWLSKFLFKKGLHFKNLHFIRDDVEEINRTLTDSLKDSDIVITSGGIGPTLDDKTKNTLAHFFGKKIVERADIAQIVTDNYIRFGRTWSPSTNHYHFFPEDFIGIPNPKGLAPGLGLFTDDKKLILSGPGVPREFSEMVEIEFFSLIKKFYPDRFKENYQTVIRTQGVPEEKIFFELCPNLWSDLEKIGKVSSLPHTIGIDIVVGYYGDSETSQKNDTKIKELILKTPLAPHVWQWGNKPINELVLNMAKAKKVTIAFAESCTGGLVSSKMTDLSGASEIFFGSVISYDNKIKENLLRVKKETLEQFGAVSVECAKEMAIGARELLKVDYAVSISGIAGPSGGSKEKPKGMVTIGYASAKSSGALEFNFPGDRIRLKERFSDQALLIMLRLMNEEI